MGSSVPRSGEPGQSWKVGALAEAAGLTVRALHHYDHLGLLTPSGRTGAGHRVYSAGDVARLYRISLLRRLGFPLAQIASLLDDPQWQLSADGADIIEEPIDQPYGVREYGARDP